MSTIPHVEANFPRWTPRTAPRSTVYAERAYQCLTIAFMLVLLASL